MSIAFLEGAEYEVALKQRQADYNHLLDELERQSELIAALRNEVAAKNERIAELEAQVALLADRLQASGYRDMDAAAIMERQTKRIAELEADYQKQYNMVTGSVQYAKSMERRIAELEAQLAAALATIDRATTDGELYAEGCKP